MRLFPEWFAEGDSAVRDAMVEAFVDAWASFASGQAAFAASADPRFATGSRLDLLGAQRDMPRQLGELDAEYSVRILSDEDIGTPRALLAAIDRILVDTTPIGRLAYYYERPDDDAFVFTKNVTSGPIAERGTYIDGKRPIRKATRLYAERGRCEPKHIFLFRSKRNAANSAVSVAIAGVPSGFVSISIPATDDETAPDNARGHCVIGLPAYIQPGRSLSSDCALHAEPAPPLLEAWGDVTAATAQRSRLQSSVFTKATTTARVGLNKPSGGAAYSNGQHPDIIVGKIRAVLAHRAMYPVKFTLMFDPRL